MFEDFGWFGDEGFLAPHEADDYHVFADLEVWEDQDRDDYDSSEDNDDYQSWLDEQAALDAHLESIIDQDR